MFSQRWWGSGRRGIKRAAGPQPGRRSRYRPCVNILEPRLAPTVTFSVSNPTPFPKPDTGRLMGMFVVTRSGDTAATVQVNYSTQDGTAHAGTDYQATSGAVYFAANQTTATVSVPILGNNIFQADKTFTLALSGPLVGVSFALQQTFAAGTNPQSVAVGDFNGDGKPDLAVVAGGHVEVLLNTTPAGATAPSFAPPRTFAPGSPNPTALAVADFNGDGKPDLAVLVNGTSVALLHNTTPAGATQPSFAPAQTHLATQYATAIAVGDFNGDGFPDVAVANSNQQNGGVAVLLGGPNGFGTPSTFATGCAANSLAVADFNGEGKPDLAVACGGIALLRNTTAAGAPTPSFAPQQSLRLQSAIADRVAVGDVNGDGISDLVVADQSHGTVSVLLNMTPRGANTFNFRETSPLPAGSDPETPAIADLNGDGRPDIIVPDLLGNTVSVLLNATAPGATTASFAPQLALASGSRSIAAAVADFNGDGKPDVAVADDVSAGTVSVLLNTRVPITVPPAFTPPRSFGTGNYPNAVAVADINGDGKPDLVIANQLTNTVSVLLNTTPPGATTPTFAPQQTFAVGSSPVAVAVANFKNLHQPDIAVANYGSNTVSVLLNTTPAGATTASFEPQHTFAVGAGPRALVAGDFNRDGEPDLAVVNRFANTVSVLLDFTLPGATVPNFVPQATFPTSTSPVAIAFGDLSGDDHRDLVVAGATTVSVLRNNTVPETTTPAFAPQQTVAVAGNPQSVAVGDLNGDGRPDLVVGTTSQGVAVLLNTTPPGATTFSFAAPRTFATGSTAPAVVIGDIDGDGKPDLAVANYSTSTLGVLLNQTAAGSTTPSFAAQQTFAAGARPTRLAEGDFNGDGRPDLALTNITAGTVSVLLNNTVESFTLGGPATGTISSAPEAPQMIAVATGNNQSATVNTAFATALAVDVRDAGGALVQNVSVTFTAPGGGASAGATFGGSATATVVTNASGRATAPALTANTIVGGYTVMARAAGGSSPFVFFSLTNTPGAPAMLTATAGSNQSTVVNTAFATNLLATLTDPFGNRVPGVTIDFIPPSTGASATFPSGFTGVTDANGQVSKAILANNVAGTYSIMAVALGGSNPMTTFVNLTNTPAAAVDHFAVTTTAANPDVAATPFDVTVTAQDANNNTVTTYTGTIHFTSADPYGATLPADYTFQPSDMGTVTFPGGATLYTAGTWDVTATDTGNSAITGSAQVTVTAAALDHFSVSTSVDGSSTVAGTPFDVTVTAQDAYNNTVTTYTGTVTFSSQDPYGATLPADYTFQASDMGMVTLSGGVTLYTAGVWDVTVTDTGTGATGTDNVTVTPAPAVQFQLSAPATVAPNTPFDVTVTALDPYGNTDVNYQGTVTFTTTDQDPGVVLPADYTFTAGDAGVHTFGGGFTLVTPGDQMLTATDTVSGISGSITVTVQPMDAPGANGPGGGTPGWAASSPGRATPPAQSPADSQPWRVDRQPRFLDGAERALVRPASPAARPAWSEAVDQLFSEEEVIRLNIKALV